MIRVLCAVIISLVMITSAYGTTQMPGDSVYNIHSKWQTQAGQEVELRTLQGRPVVIVMAYTSCQNACPLIVEEMRGLESHLANPKSVLFVLASFDSKRDSAEHLKQFAQQHKLDLKNWILLHGSARSVQDLAAVLGVRYKEDAQGDFDHSNLITILDSNGVIRFQQTGINEGVPDIEKKLTDMTKGFQQKEGI